MYHQNWNPSDIGSRGCYIRKSDYLWFYGPSWLQAPDEWPLELIVESSDQSEAEAKPIKSVFMMRVEINEEKWDKLDEIFEKFQFREAIRVIAWVMRFIRNSIQVQEKKTHKWSSDYTRDQRPRSTFLDKKSSV